MAKVITGLASYAGKRGAAISSAADRAFVHAAIVLVGHVDITLLIYGHALGLLNCTLLVPDTPVPYCILLSR